MRKSKRANYAVMEIRNFHTFTYNSDMYIYTSISIEKEVRF